MAAGDVFDTGLVSTDWGDYVDVKPSTPDEAVVHNIYIPVGLYAQLYRSDGVNESLIDSSAEGWEGFQWHVTADNYLRIKNASGDVGGPVSGYVGADGMFTK